MRIGIVTCEKCKTLTDSERPLIPLLKEHNLTATPVVWNDPSVSWTSFDFLLVRSIWDYHLYPGAFVAWLSTLENFNINTWNPVPVLLRNHQKTYLRFLEEKGVRIVPTLFQNKGTTDALNQAKSRGWDRVVVKPAISASAYRTETLDLSDQRAEEILDSASSHGDFLIQKFMPAVQRSGELSIIFINHAYSHAVLKRPQAGEFRVQKEFGGNAISVQPDNHVIQAAKSILTQFGGELLYARVDGIVVDGEFVLMELELIEPDLFLGSHPQAMSNFVTGIRNRIETA